MKLLLIVTLLSGAHCNSIRCPVKLTAKERGRLTIECSYDKYYKNYTKYWCKGRIFSHCRILEDTHSSENNRRISISDNKKKNIYYVTMNDLREDDNGTYWCGIALFLADKACQVDIVVEKDPRMNLTVEQTTPKVSTVTASSAHTTEIYSEIGTGTSSTWKASPAQNIAIISVGLLLLLFCLAIAVITWRLKSKQVKQTPRNTDQSPDEEVNYVDVTRSKPAFESIYANMSIFAAEQHVPHVTSVEYAAINCQ